MVALCKVCQFTTPAATFIPGSYVENKVSLGFFMMFSGCVNYCVIFISETLSLNILAIFILFIFWLFDGFSMDKISFI